MFRPTDSPKSPPTSDRRPVGDAAVIMVVFMAILWAVQIVDSVTHYPLLRLGIDPRSVGKIEDIFTAPFIHASYNHLLGNTLPLLVLGLFVALRGIRRFLLITGVIVLISGLGKPEMTRL